MEQKLVDAWQRAGHRYRLRASQVDDDAAIAADLQQLLGTSAFSAFLQAKADDLADELGKADAALLRADAARLGAEGVS